MTFAEEYDRFSMMISHISQSYQILFLLTTVVIVIGNRAGIKNVEVTYNLFIISPTTNSIQLNSPKTKELPGKKLIEKLFS